MSQVHSHEPEELTGSRTAAVISVAMALLKLGVGLSAGSLSLIASGVDSVFDAIASAAGFFMLRMALEPADKEHPYGHSRIESVASLAQGVLLLFISMTLAYAAAQRFDHRHEMREIDGTLYVPLVCTIVTLGLWIYLGRIAQRTGSSVIAGDRVHYFTDLAGNLLLCVGFVISRLFNVYNVDAILTLILCIFIFSSAVKILANSVKDLVDHSDPEVEKKIETVLTQFYPEALGASRLRTRRSGRRTATDLELISCRQMRFQDVHDISHKVQRAILSEVPNVDIIIHSEPCTIEECASEQACQYQAKK